MNTKKIKQLLHQRETEDIKTIAQLHTLNYLTAKDAMISPIFLQETDSITTILQKLHYEDVSACIVVDKHHHFVGEISVEDIIKLFVEQLNKEPMIKYLTRGYKKGLYYKNAGSLCNKHNCVVYEDSHINTVIREIYNPKCTYVPVINKQNYVLGVITPSSLINLLKDY